MLIAALALLPARAPEAREVWHAARALVPGDTLRGQDLDAAAPERDRLELIDASRDIVGLEVKRRLREGMPIPARSIGERDMVRASQPVRVLWKSDGMTLELNGKALESGVLGAEIRVHNAGSGRTIRAVVVADGTAEIQNSP